MKKLLILILFFGLIVGCQKKEKKPISKEILTREILKLPEYKIHDVVNKISGGRFADILIPTISLDTSTDSLSKIAFAIIKKEGFDEASFYCTEEAIKAMYSNSYSKKHPNAFKEGFLGSINNNRFFKD